MNENWTAERLFSDIDMLSDEVLELENWLTAVVRELSGLQVSQSEVTRLAGFWLLHFVHRVHGIVSETEEYQDTHFELGEQNHILPVFSDRREEMHAMGGAIVNRKAWDNFITDSWRRLSLSGGFKLVKSDVHLSKPSVGEILGTSVGHRFWASNSHRRLWISHPYLKIPTRELCFAQMKSRNWASWLPSTARLNRFPGELLYSKRIGLSKIVPITNFRSLLKVMLPLMIPFGYAEGLKFHYVELHDRFPCPPKVLHSAIGLQVDHLFQVAASSWSDTGTKVCSHQHGGHSGLDERHVLEELEIRASDRYYTFGWGGKADKIRPLPMPLPRRQRGRRSSKILVMSLESSDYIYRLQPFNLPSHARSCFRETFTFVKFLELRRDLVVRCSERDWSRMGLSSGGVSWESLKKSGTASASTASLVVHNYLGTSWLETLAMNIPTVCFVPKGIHRFRAAAQPFTDALANVGIIHYSGREAADFVNSLRGNPSSWWRLAEVQEAREAFVARYANFSENWLEAWQAEFESLLAE